MLLSIYKDAKNGRGWKHYVGTDKASIQPWNQLVPEQAGSQIAAVMMSGFLFVLIGANSPDGKIRDQRVNMWDPKVGIMSTSKIKSDRNLVRAPKNFLKSDGTAKGIASYFKYVLSNQRPPVVGARSNSKEYKSDFLIVENTSQSALQMLKKAKPITTYDLITGEKQLINPSLKDVFNGFDYLYFPRFGSRIRIFIENPDKVDPSLFAKAVEEENDKLVLKMLKSAGIDKVGFGVLAEGRVAATNLPNKFNKNWTRTAMPFVLQTSIIRSHKAILKKLNYLGIKWEEAVEKLPQIANEFSKGFNGKTKSGHQLSELGLTIWEIAKKSLAKEELELIMYEGKDQIKEILKNKRAGSEEKLELASTVKKGSIKERISAIISEYEMWN